MKDLWQLKCCKLELQLKTLCIPDKGKPDPNKIKTKGLLSEIYRILIEGEMEEAKAKITQEILIKTISAKEWSYLCKTR